MFKDIEYYENKSLKDCTTFKIGGYARYFVLPRNILELKKTIKICKTANLHYFIIGNGSNILADDKGYDGVIISLKHFNKLKKIKKEGNERIYVESGTSLYILNKYLLKNGFSGLEWSYGIPGTIGGAIIMNAGAFNHCIFEFIDEITLLKNNKIVKINQFNYSYRNSNLTNEIIISAQINVKKANMLDIQNKMNLYLQERQSNQPYNFPSAGSIFKRNNEIIPAKIIDELNLKGLRIGDAMISTKHSGFIINIGNATSDDVKKLIQIIKQIAQYAGYLFNEEIIYL